MPIRWGIIGCGDVAEVKSGPGFQQARDSALVAVMRRNRAMAADYAIRHDVPRWYDDADALIANPEVDAVYIATPPGSHMDYALKVCTAGKPCYIEKPMARNHAECEQMVSTFRAAKLPLFVAYYRRALDRFVNAKNLVSAGAIGTVTGVNYRFTAPAAKLEGLPLPWRLQAEHAGGGLFMDLGCHTLDIMDFMVGPLKNEAGVASNCAGLYDVEDTVALSFVTQGGAPGTAHWNFAGAYIEDVIEITGTKGRISLSTFGNEPAQLFTADGIEKFDLPNPVHIQTPMIRTIVDELLGRGTCPSTGESAQRTARIMDTALDSYYGGRSDAFWARPDTWPGRPRTSRE
jgi:predicted dehydrogenase